MSTPITSSELKSDVPAALRDAAQTPVTITDDGRPTHVLLSVEGVDGLSSEVGYAEVARQREGDRTSHQAAAQTPAGPRVRGGHRGRGHGRPPVSR